MWKPLFNAFLNIPSCQELPNISSFRAEFEDYFREYYLEEQWKDEVAVVQKFF